MAVLRIFAALGCGFVFGPELAISGMMSPARVVGVLDVAGSWDPTLGFVMGGALLVAVPAYRVILGRGRPVLAGGFTLPARTRLDTPLILGSALFGVGWGLVGFCPGPAVAAVVSGLPSVLGFVGGSRTAPTGFRGCGDADGRRGVPGRVLDDVHLELLKPVA
jgi:uncharacterized protein